MAIGHQSFYQTQLTSAISDTDLIIPLDTVPTVSEGFLVIESTVEAKREIIYYTSKDASSVTCPSGAGNGRGYDGTTAVSHLQGATVIMAPVGAMFEKLGDISVNSITIGSTTSAEGWSPLGATPSTITNNGNHSTDLTFTGVDLTSTLSEGMRLRTTRTVPTQTQCTSLNGTNQYWSKTSPAGFSFTVTNTVMGWRKINAYSAQWFGGRTTGTNGFRYGINASGQLVYEAQPGNGTTKLVTSYQSVSLNKGFRYAFQIDLAGTCAIMLDGVNIPSTTTGSATSLTQAGDLQLGAANGAGFTVGNMAQDAFFSTNLSDATVRSYECQSFTGSEPNLISAFTFDGNGNSIGTSNNLTAQGGATATEPDSPFGNSGASSTKDYAIVMSKPVYSGGDTTVTVQTPEGSSIPTSGGVSSVDYSSASVPFGFPREESRWRVSYTSKVASQQTSPTASTWYNPSGAKVVAPVGRWKTRWQAAFGGYRTTSVTSVQFKATLSTSASAESDAEQTAWLNQEGSSSLLAIRQTANRERDINITTATPLYLNVVALTASSDEVSTYGSLSPTIIELTPAYL